MEAGYHGIAQSFFAILEWDLLDLPSSTTLPPGQLGSAATLRH